MAKQYWLMKSEPDVFSIDDLKKQKTSLWDGVRNYQARNFMMKDMKVGDEVLFYHSNATPPGVVGLAEVSEPATPDPTQYDKKSEYFAEKASKEKPIWYCVKVKFKSKFPQMVALEDIKDHAELNDMLVVQRGQRLSIQPVEPQHFETIKKLGGL
ncbi:MAG: EVE domain-containing protein [Pseudobdellovibrionaceae bacterium]|nr:EVE domain-containing protein [Bdellovibrionales bacterium]USN47846.1 MAG: EVE domain-containing protein [Pseudobdellovibrionaceae bacterium]